MVRTQRCSLVAVAACLLLVLCVQADDRADTARDFAIQQEDQKRVQADTDRLVRRMDTMLRVLSYHQLDGSPEQKLLDDIAATLAGLSREQMADVVLLLDRAEKQPEDPATQATLDKAYARHREIVDTLRRLLARYEALRGLEEAATRFEKASRQQLDLQLQTQQLSTQQPNARLGRRDPLRLQTFQRADDQLDLRRDTAGTLEDLDKLKGLLPPELQERVTKAENLAREQKVVDTMKSAAEQIRALRAQDAVKDQAKAARALQDLSHLLRPERDRLAALREARQRLERVSTEQEKVHEATEAEKAQRPEPKKDEKKEEKKETARRPEPPKNDEAARKSQELGDRQARLEHETRDLRRLVKPHAAVIEDQIAKAEGSMRQAEQGLRENLPAQSVQPQMQALEALDEAKANLDQMIAEAERQRHDPLKALEKAKENLDRLLQDQKQTRQKTVEAAAGKQPERLPQLARTQEDLARRADELMHQPMPAKPETQQAMNNALKAMDKATDELDKKKGPEAVTQQDKAIKALEAAKKQVDQQAADIQKRREEMAKLEQAGQRLEEMAKRERELGNKARDESAMANNDTPKPEAAKPDTAKPNGAKPDTPPKSDKRPMPQARAVPENPKPSDPRQMDATKALAKEQAEMRKEATELGQELKNAAPDAAKSVGESTEKMQAAERNLEKNQRQPAAENVDMAADKLMEARDQLAKAMDQRKAQEAADEAMTRPGEVDLANTAAQLAEARQKAMQAAEQSQQAARRLRLDARERPSEREAASAGTNLAGMQKELADKADAAGMKDAAVPADQAARFMEAANLRRAVQNQRKALDEFEKLAKQGSEKNGDQKPLSAQDMANMQKQLLDATKSLAESQAANEAAMSALEQARAHSPSALQPMLNQAGQKLSEAGEQLPRGQAQQASQNQRDAAGQLGQALQAVQQAMAQMDQQQGQNPSSQASRQRGQQPNQQQANNGKSQERNENQGQGNRTPDGQGKDADSKLTDAKGDGTFVKLPPRDREIIRQALQEKLPPEYAAQIRQYYINLAKGKAADKPAMPERK